MNFLKELLNIFMVGDEQGGNPKIYRYIILLGMLGVLFLLFGGSFFLNTGSDQPAPVDSSPVKSHSDSKTVYGEKLASELEEIISLIKGVGTVKVKVYIKTGVSYNYEYNDDQVNKITNETDQDGGERRIEEDNQERELVIIQDAGGNETPVVKKEIFPELSGILIVAQGAEVSRIKYDIIRAVSSLLDLPVHKISVLPFERG